MLIRSHPAKVKVTPVAPENLTPRAVAPPGDSVSVWYIRHGENPANLTGELSCRRVDYPLTDHGVEQARALAGLLSREPAPAAIYASPLRRAAQTAQILATRLGLPVCTLEGLRELDVGDLEGRSDEQAWELYLEVAYAWQAGDHDRAYPGGEDFRHVLARLRAALTRALDHPPGSRVLMVAHDGLIRASLPALCPGAAPPATGLPKCGIAKLSVRETPDGPASRPPRLAGTLEAGRLLGGGRHGQQSGALGGAPVAGGGALKAALDPGGEVLAGPLDVLAARGQPGGPVSRASCAPPTTRPAVVAARCRPPG